MCFTEHRIDVYSILLSHVMNLYLFCFLYVYAEVELKEVIEKSKNNELQESDSAALNLCKLMNFLVYIALFAIAFFCMNVMTNGDFGRMVSKV